MSSSVAALVLKKQQSFFGILHLEDEIEAENEKQAQKQELQRLTSTAAIVCPNAGNTKLSRHDAAQQVVNDQLQWKKMQQQMKEKGAVTSISLKQSLGQLLKDRVKEMNDEGAKRTQPPQPRPALSTWRPSINTGNSLSSERRYSEPRSSTAGSSGHCSTGTPRRRFSLTLGDVAASLANETAA